MCCTVYGTASIYKILSLPCELRAIATGGATVFLMSGKLPEQNCKVSGLKCKVRRCPMANIYLRPEMTIVTQHKIIIITAPSGAGKTSITRQLLKTYPDQLAFSISATT